MIALLFPPDSELAFPHGKWRRNVKGVVVYVERLTAAEQWAMLLAMEALREVEGEGTTNHL